MISNRPSSPPTRRALLLGGGAFVVMQATGCDASPRKSTSSNAAPQSDNDDSARIQAMVDAGDTLLPSRRYLLSRPIMLPEGRKLVIAADTMFHYTGGEGGGVFRVAGDNVTIEAQGSGATISSSRPRLDLWAVEAISPRHLRIVGINARDCGHVHIGTGDLGYDDIIVAGSNANVANDITIVGGGARYAQPTEAGNGACWIEYATDWRVENALYEHVPHGVEWWGGNAAFDADGKPGAERKCQRFHIKNVTVRNATLGGIWGAMGQDGVVEACTVERCGDVGLDAEGCRNVRFTNCTASDARNGCLATFFSSDNILFEKCIVTSSCSKWPLFRSYNASQNPASGGNVRINSCVFTCSEKMSVTSIDTSSGPLAKLVINKCTLNNVFINTNYNNMHCVEITSNSLVFSALNAVAITTGSSRMIGDNQGGCLISGNNIVFTSKGRAAIHIIENDFNSSSSSFIENNNIVGPVETAFKVENLSDNKGSIPIFNIKGNTVNGAVKVLKINKGADSSSPKVIFK